jgi:hypothetical protein
VIVVDKMGNVQTFRNLKIKGCNDVCMLPTSL